MVTQRTRQPSTRGPQGLQPTNEVQFVHVRDLWMCLVFRIFLPQKCEDLPVIKRGNGKSHYNRGLK